MSNWETKADGERIDINEYLDFRQYDTIADRDAAAVGFGSAELFHICRVVATGYYYYWNGAAWSQFPSMGGAGAPPSCSFVTINAEGDLSAETQHKNIVGADLHVTKAHASEHENAGADEISVAGLSGVLADDQDADHIKGIEVDDAAIADGSVLGYRGASGKIEYIAAPAPGAHAATHENGGGDEISVAGLSGELADNQPPKAHKDTHKTGGADPFAAADLLDGVARTTLRRNSGANTGSRRRLNFIDTASATWTLTDDAADEEVDVQVTCTNAGAYKLTPSYTIYLSGGTYYAMDEDGNIDFSGANAGTVINDAITAASGGMIFLNGSITLSSSTGINANQTGTRVTGLGYDTVIRCSGTFNDHIIHASATGCFVDNLRIDGTNQSGGYHGIYIEGARSQTHHVRIEDCGGDGIHVGHSSWVGVMGGKIHHSTLTGNAGNGLYLDYDATDWEVSDCLIASHTGAGKAGIVLDGSSNMIHLCHLWGNYYNVILAPAHHVYRLRLVQNGIMDNKRHGIYKSSAYNFRDSVIAGNSFWAHGMDAADTYDSIYIASTGDVLCVAITGNAFYGYKEDVTTQYTRYAINDSASNMDYCTIVGNTFDRYFEADPVNVPAANNEEAHNTFYMNG